MPEVSFVAKLGRALGCLGLIFAPLLVSLPVVILFALLRDPVDEDCEAKEFIIGKAGRCLAQPWMWKEWHRIANAYDMRDPGCEHWVEALGKLDVAPETVVLAERWTDAHHGSRRIRQFWNQELNEDFCTVSKDW